MNTRFFATRTVRHTRWLALNHPPVNFLTTEVLAELLYLIREAEQDEAVRVIVLTGGLPDRYIFHFSIPELVQAGIDSRRFKLNTVFGTPWLAAVARWQTALNMRLMQRFPGYERLLLALARRLRARWPTLLLFLQMVATYAAIENCRKLTVAAINGTCNGGGTEMAACFDFRFMVGDAGFSIGQPEVLVGIIAGGGGTQRVTRLIGQARALEFMLACEQWTPQQAKAAGLITDHFPKAEFVDAVQAYADRLSRRSLIACRESRRAIRRGGEGDIERGLALELAGYLRCADDAGTQAVLAEYAAYLDAEVMQKPEAPASVAHIVQIMESECFAKHYLPR